MEIKDSTFTEYSVVHSIPKGNSVYQADVVIVGGGLAGLATAFRLQQKNIHAVIIEKEDTLGGRIQTDLVEGFRLDRGFQVLLTAYPLAQKMLDYQALDLKIFDTGAIILGENGQKQRIGDPARQLSSLFPTLFSSIGTFQDKLKMLSLKNHLMDASIDNIFERAEISTIDALKSYGFSDSMIEQFFEPFFGSILLDREMKASRRMFDFTFKMFSQGFAAIPANGIGEITKQLANKIAPQTIFTGRTVEKVEGTSVFTQNGEEFKAKKIILATQLAQVLNGQMKPFQGTTSLYFSGEEAPFSQPTIALNTLKNRLINNICPVSNVSKSYAPDGKHLIALSTIGVSPILDEKTLIQTAKSEMKQWFGNQVDTWQHLKTYHIPNALPSQLHVKYNLSIKDLQLKENIYTCGDYLSNSSINAALLSAEVLAEGMM